jgi:hypothetical protein
MNFPRQVEMLSSLAIRDGSYSFRKKVALSKLGEEALQQGTSRAGVESHQADRPAPLTLLVTTRRSSITSGIDSSGSAARVDKLSPTYRSAPIESKRLGWFLLKSSCGDCAASPSPLVAALRIEVVGNFAIFQRPDCYVWKVAAS